jgi:hypothetical protein
MRTARSLCLSSIALSASLIGCMTPEDGFTDVPIEGREDLAQRIFHTRIVDGLSDELVIEAPDGLQSVLMEIRGKKGLYYLSKFQTPSGDLIEGGTYTTRFAREVPGLVDWLYPNSPNLAMEPGEYKILLRGEETNGDKLNEDIEVRFYAKKQTGIETCGIHLDYLIDKNSIDSTQFEIALDRATAWVNNLYAPMGVRVLDYTTTQIGLPDPNFNVDDTSTVMGQIDDVLRQARSVGTARQDSLHVVVVRTIGGSEPSGYSMGLPGPFDADRANAAVLVSTDAYTDSENLLDVEGMASTIAHEVGHYLGLYHTSESSGTQHDPIPDSPQCDGSVCSGEFEKNIMSSGGGASRVSVSEGQAFVIKQHPLCVPTQFEVVAPTCDLSCTAPQTCSIIAGDKQCRQACDPDAPECSSGTCKPDSMGTFVCAP